jgi:hypothetical protein
LLIEQLSEFLKLAKIVVLSIFGFVENECSFSTLAFMKDMLRHRLGLTLNMIVQMFAQESYTQENFFYHGAITTWKDRKVRINAAT